MRAFEIFLFLVCIIVMITAVNTLNIFPEQYVVPDTQLTSGMDLNAVSEQYNGMSNLGVLDYFYLVAKLTIISILALLQMFVKLAIFAPFLATAFGMPLALAAALNVILYVIIAIGIAQFISGRSIDQMR